MWACQNQSCWRGVWRGLTEPPARPTTPKSTWLARWLVHTTKARPLFVRWETQYTISKNVSNFVNFILVYQWKCFKTYRCYRDLGFGYSYKTEWLLVCLPKLQSVGWIEGRKEVRTELAYQWLSMCRSLVFSLWENTRRELAMNRSCRTLWWRKDRHHPTWTEHNLIVRGFPTGKQVPRRLQLNL